MIDIKCDFYRVPFLQNIMNTCPIIPGEYNFKAANSQRLNDAYMRQ